VGCTKTRGHRADDCSLLIVVHTFFEQVGENKRRSERERERERRQGKIKKSPCGVVCWRI
jgi:hypothetical protein